MKKTAIAVVLLVAFALPLAAAELHGVKLSETAVVDGKNLALNGAGLRTKAIFKVYVAALYVENKSADPAAIVASEQTKRVEMVMLRDLGKGKIVEAIREGFEKNAKSQMPALKARLDKFVSGIPDLKEGQRLVITYEPGKGTSLTSNSGAAMSVPGKDFADALFSVWLGKSPVDEKLKSGMLGK